MSVCMWVSIAVRMNGRKEMQRYAYSRVYHVVSMVHTWLTLAQNRTSVKHIHHGRNVRLRSNSNVPLPNAHNSFYIILASNDTDLVRVSGFQYIFHNFCLYFCTFGVIHFSLHQFIHFQVNWCVFSYSFLLV